MGQVKFLQGRQSFQLTCPRAGEQKNECRALHQKPRCKTPVYCCNQKLEYAETYKYLGYYLHEHLSHKKTVDTLSSSAQRSFGRIVNIFKSLKNMGIKTFETLYFSYVTPISTYGSAVWGFQEQHEPQILQNRVGRFFLGVNKFTPVAATSIELDWMNPRFSRWIEMVRYRNRLVNMDPCRLPVRIYNWEKSLNHKGWVKDVQFIMQYCNLEYDVELTNECDLDMLSTKLLKMNRDKWWVEAHNKPKLRTFVKIHDTEFTQVLVRKNLSRKHRSLIAKFKCGVLPIALETGRYTDVPEAKRTCKLCSDNAVETEEHFLTACSALSHIRTRFKNELNEVENLDNMTGIEKMKRMMATDMIKISSRMLECMFEERKELMYEDAIEGDEDDDAPTLPGTQHEQQEQMN